MAVGALDLLEERQELLVAVSRRQGRGDLAGGYVERGEQGGGAPSFITGLVFE